MTTAVAVPEIVGKLSDDGVRDLRETLIYCHEKFQTYRHRFDSAGIDGDDLLYGDPVELLGYLRPLDADDYARVADESLAVVDGIVDMETSSGTSGRPKRRFISEQDADLEESLLARLFTVSGIGPGDRVACLDVDPLAVMASFTAALERLGVEEAYSYSVGPDFDRSLAGLRRLDPTVVISVPSIIDRCLPALTDRFDKKTGSRLAKIVFVGEPLPDRTRGTLEGALGVEVFSYYGAAETSAMGIECSAHDGVHLFTDHNMFELLPRVGGGPDEVLVTSLKLRTTPLLRYTIGDVIAPKSGQCRCGLDFPRVDIPGRTGDSFTVLGASVGYGALHDSVYGGEAGPMQIILERDTKEVVTVVLSRELERDAPSLRETVLATQPELEFLVTGDYLELDFSFVDAVERKQRRVVDLRGSDAD